MHHGLQGVQPEAIQLESPVGNCLLALNLLFFKRLSIVLALNLTEDLHLHLLNDIQLFCLKAFIDFVKLVLCFGLLHLQIIKER